jgi:hypothetical protein
LPLRIAAIVIAPLLNSAQAVESRTIRPQLQNMSKPPARLEDPQYAAFAWARFRRILGWMAAAALVAVAIAEVALYRSLGELQIVTALATAGGVFFTIMLTAALMGLVFLSSGTGHDEQVEDLLKDEVDID